MSYKITVLKNSFYYYLNKLTLRAKPTQKTRHIHFVCTFHENTGGSSAMCTLANTLADNIQVTFYSYPASKLNQHLNRKVKIINQQNINANFYIIDLSCSTQVVKALKARNKEIILSIHGLRNTGHALTETHINEMLSLADHIHFVSDYQKNNYNAPAHKTFVIPNAIPYFPVNRPHNRKNVGCVGNLDIPEKNCALTVKAALKASTVNEILLWGTNKNWSESDKVKAMGWEHNKSKIYSSFDVLVFLSESETFGLVVAEALCAGIPCVLSTIPGFAQFENIPGVKLVNKNSNNINDSIDDMLNYSHDERMVIAQIAKKKFGLASITNTWLKKLTKDS
ncbi:glycosyltransferase family 4 protein [Thalassotalea agariperforans]